MWGCLADRPVIIGAPFELSLPGNGRAVALAASMIHAFITTVRTLQLHTLHNFVTITMTENYKTQMEQ